MFVTEIQTGLLLSASCQWNVPDDKTAIASWIFGLECSVKQNMHFLDYTLKILSSSWLTWYFSWQPNSLATIPTSYFGFAYSHIHCSLETSCLVNNKWTMYWGWYLFPECRAKDVAASVCELQSKFIISQLSLTHWFGTTLESH